VYELRKRKFDFLTKLWVCCKLLRNQPAGLCFLVFAMIQTCACIQVTSQHNADEQVNLSANFEIGNRFHAKRRILMQAQ